MPLGHGGSLSWDEGVTSSLSQMRRQSVQVTGSKELQNSGCSPCWCTPLPLKARGDRDSVWLANRMTCFIKVCEKPCCFSAVIR